MAVEGEHVEEFRRVGHLKLIRLRERGRREGTEWENK